MSALFPSSRRPPGGWWVLLAALAAAGTTSAASPMAVTIRSGWRASDYARFLTGCGVTVADARFNASLLAIGTFTGATDLVGIGDGLVISSGSVAYLGQANSSDSITTNFNRPGDDGDLNTPGLQSLVSQPTFDAAVLEFDFIPSSTTVTFDYVFSSDEYNEWANTIYNDVFAFFLGVPDVATGQTVWTNLAVVPGTTATPVSINNVNGGNPYGTGPVNPQYHLCNASDGCSLIVGSGFTTTRWSGFELDGLTVVFTVTATVAANQINRIKFAIADAGDHVLDSAVFIRAGSFTAGPCGAAGGAGSATVIVTGTPPPHVRPVPNPWRPGAGGRQDAPAATLLIHPAGSSVRIYTLAGALVAELADADGDAVIAWDGRNAAGTAVASGIYQLLLASPQGGIVARNRLVVAR